MKHNPRLGEVSNYFETVVQQVFAGDDVCDFSFI